MAATAKYISEESSAAAGVLNQKLSNDTEKRDILKISLIESAREPRFRPRTTARKVQTSMRWDHDIVNSLFTSMLRLDFHLCFFFVFCNFQKFNTIQTKS